MDCRKCGLWKTRTNIVTYRGELPAELLFVGEGPGAYEDYTGIPFCGPSGELLDYILETVSNYVDFTYCITNIVRCWPKECGSSRVPTVEECEACSTNLLDIIKKCKPRTIVAIGKEVNIFLEGEYKGNEYQVAKKLGYLHTNPNERKDKLVPVVQILHPSYILRSPLEKRTEMIHKQVSILLDILGR